MMRIISQRQRFEHFQRRHATFRETVANLVHHLPAEFADDVADPPGVSRLDAIEQDGEMIGKDGALRAMPAGIVGHGVNELWNEVVVLPLELLFSLKPSLIARDERGRICYRRVRTGEYCDDWSIFFHISSSPSGTLTHGYFVASLSGISMDINDFDGA